jgi:hypothetical protein
MQSKFNINDALSQAIAEIIVFIGTLRPGSEVNKYL